MSICTNQCTNQHKVRKTVPTTVPTTFNKWQNSAEMSQAHNLKVVGSNPTPATNFLNKITSLDHPKRLWFLGFFYVLSTKISKEWLTMWLKVVRHISLF